MDRGRRAGLRKLTEEDNIRTSLRRGPRRAGRLQLGPPQSPSHFTPSQISPGKEDEGKREPTCFGSCSACLRQSPGQTLAPTESGRPLSSEDMFTEEGRSWGR